MVNNANKSSNRVAEPSAAKSVDTTGSAGAKATTNKHQSAGEKRFQDQRSEREYNREAKRRAYGLEIDNLDKLILFRSTHGYWKMGGVSALEFYYHIAEKAGYYNAILNPDRDFYSKFPDGVISIKALTTFDQRLSQLGITFDCEDAGVRIYKLGYAINEKDLAEMRNERRTLLKRANQNVAPKVINAELYAKLKMLLRTAYAKVKKMDSIDREFLGNRTLQAIRQAILLYTQYCNADEPDKQLLCKMEQILRAMMADSMMYVEVGIWDPRHCVSEYQDQILDTVTLVRKELNIAK